VDHQFNYVYLGVSSPGCRERMRIRWDTESSRSYRVSMIVPSSTDYMNVSSVLVALHPVLPTGGTEIDILVLLFSCRLEKLNQVRTPPPHSSYPSENVDTNAYYLMFPTTTDIFSTTLYNVSGNY